MRLNPWPRKSAPAAVEDPPGRHRSLALPEIASIARRFESPRILDLGLASSGNLHFYSRFQARVNIADLYVSVRDSHGRLPPDAEELDEALGKHLPAESFDLIMAWDLLNYFDPPRLGVLGRHLAQRSERGSYLFGIVYTGSQMPDRPLDFEILGKEVLRYRGNLALRRPGPQYREPQITKQLAPYRVSTSFLLRHSVQEYVMVRGADATPTAEDDE